MSDVLSMLFGSTAKVVGINIFIIFFTIFLGFELSRVKKEMIKINTAVESAHKTTIGKIMRNSRGNIESGFSTEIDRDALVPLRKNFNEQVVRFYSWANLISILPLLGLLGTVFGLIPGLGAVKNGDFDVLYTSLSTALLSTFWGLICVIILKIYVSLSPGKLIDKVEAGLAEIDRLYEMH